MSSWGGGLWCRFGAASLLWKGSFTYALLTWLFYFEDGKLL